MRDSRCGGDVRSGHGFSGEANGWVMGDAVGVLFLGYLAIELRFFARLPLVWGGCLGRRNIGSRCGRESRSILGQLRSRNTNNKYANLSF